VIRAVATVNNRCTMFVGLDRNNTTMLHEGHPIAIDVQAIMAQVPADQVQDLVIFAGETLKAAHEELGEYLPLPPFDQPEGGDDRPPVAP
jgi:hypothetical protein